MQRDSTEEWPALNDVVSKNTTDGRKSKNGQAKSQSKYNNKTNGATGYDSSKENKGAKLNGNSGAHKKKKPTKTLWQPLQIEPQPYRKRGTGRHVNESVRSSENYKKNRSRNEYSNDFENARGHFRNGGFRGRRGRSYTNYRSRREEQNSPTSQVTGVLINGLTFFPHAYTDIDLKNCIKHQMEYYFSDTNLCSDFYLRKLMDSQGFVLLEEFLKFPRIEGLSIDLDTLANALVDSNKLELQGDRVRRVVDPLGWRLTEEQIASDPCFAPADDESIVVNNTALLNEDDSNSNVEPLVDQVANLHLIGVASFPANAFLDEPEHHVQSLPNVNEQVNEAVCPVTVSPPELDIELHGVYLENAAINGNDYCFPSSSTLEQANGIHFFSGSVCNDVLFYDSDPLSTQATYYTSSSETSSNSSDDSPSIHISPEPSR